MQRNRVFDVFDLTQPIKVLEGLEVSNPTGSEVTFKRGPLKGFYKVHFTSPRFLVRNLLNFAQSEFGERHFQKIWNDAVQANETGFVDEAFAKRIAHHMTIDPIQMKSRTGRMTGEWVVFHKHEGKNYYLTLAAHDEEDEKIHQRVLLALEFDNLPFSRSDG